MNVESAVKERYAACARRPDQDLCCPVPYDAALLEAIPQEVLDRDYGCGDPSRYLRAGETVLDLGSGAGKICFLAAQVVGPQGRVIGVDMTDEMIEVARRNAPLVAKRVGYANVEFRKGRIQDLSLDLERFEDELHGHPIDCADSFLKASQLADELRLKQPLVPNESVDVVVSNCVLNLVETQSKRRLFEEIFRVLRRGGRAVISDIVSDKEVPEELQTDPELWSGCIAGSLTEDAFLRAFAHAGFNEVRVLQRETRPWRTIHGIEFRSITIEALKSSQGAEIERNREVNSVEKSSCCAAGGCC